MNQFQQLAIAQSVACPTCKEPVDKFCVVMRSPLYKKYRSDTDPEGATFLTKDPHKARVRAYNEKHGTTIK